MKHLIIINPKSFASEADMTSVIRDFKAYFDSTGAEYFAYVSRYPRDAIGVVKKYVRETNETVRVYSVGGDGILYDCLNGMFGFANAQLAVVPYGTACDFVRAFGEGHAPVFRDIKKQATAGIVPTDVINIGARHVLNFCAAGIEASSILKFYEMSRKYPNMTRMIGSTVYMVGAPMAVMDMKVVWQEYELTIDGVSYDGYYAGINIANNACYGGDKMAVPMAHPADGFLDVIITKSISRRRIFRLMMDYTNGKYYKYPDSCMHVRCKEISLRSPSPLQLSADGEAYYDERLDAKIVPKAVNIVAPDNLTYVTRREIT